MTSLLYISTALAAAAFAIQDSGLTFDHYALRVKNLKSSAHFYKNILQLTEIEDKTKKETRRWFSLGSQTELHLLEGNTDGIHVIQDVHLALSSPNLDALMDRLRKHNVPFSGAHGEPNFNVRPDGIRQIFFQDPNGYWIEVNDIKQQ